jgi:nucleoside-diphosphate-sugar epimerase
MAKLIFGCGYLGLRVARRWMATGHVVFAVTRRTRRAAELDAVGIRPIVADVTNSLILPDIKNLETVLFAVGFDRRSGKTIHDVYVRGLHSALGVLPDSVGRILYVSSTGVYGQSNGEWIDEKSACRPLRQGGRACLEAEQLLARHPLGGRAVVLRLAGLYGPQRLPQLNALRAGTPLEVAASGFLNLIHVDDAAQVVLAAENRAAAPRCYLVADGNPVQRREFYVEAARLLSLPEPCFREPGADAAERRRAITSKRARNARMIGELGVRLRYPSYREGLLSVAAEMS